KQAADTDYLDNHRQRECRRERTSGDASHQRAGCGRPGGDQRGHEAHTRERRMDERGRFEMRAPYQERTHRKRRRSLTHRFRNLLDERGRVRKALPWRLREATVDDLRQPWRREWSDGAERWRWRVDVQRQQRLVG